MKRKIAVLGIGGIGGFIGFQLAKFYNSRPNTEIIFITRGAAYDQIKNEGLMLEQASGTSHVFPGQVIREASECGTVDVLIIASKSHSLLSALRDYQTIIKDTTVVLTLQNMVNASELLQKNFKEINHILEGCIYVSSNIKAPGFISHKGGPGLIYVGGKDNEYTGRAIMNLLDAGVRVEFRKDIRNALWSKFPFVSPVSVVTAAYNISFGEILEDQEVKAITRGLMEEVYRLAQKEGVLLEKNAVDQALNKLYSFPYTTQTSFQLDYLSERNTEQEFLLDFVIERSREYRLDTPLYKMVTSHLNLVKR
ncbi:2-dehydropantoate 2-reductase [Zunongwangia sp. F363]|uniref:2-dehydropantoate 2-reductase n=1 Tax=Autumnicola tepida TaxID=3075595 RepID=A0ABU3CEU7_9FLAO|nr:2-dehydropantoate 2-reductase [Zunongwangia sp. F363]MDT0644831.1 2-dehydropantoate 2-reductase [Zunongwangia sp. F363]